jgi:hypothetical protein
MRVKPSLRGLGDGVPALAPLAASVGVVATALSLYALTYATFGRDQGIFQYVAWALRHGDRVYRELHEINGPLPHLWHATLQLMGGEDEHVFRTIDTAMMVAAYATAGATVPRWVGLETKLPATLAWALAGCTVLGAQYVRFDWWSTTQREGLYSVLVLASLCLQVHAHTTERARAARLALAAAGFFTTLTWFGKPPCAIFAVLQATVVILDRRALVIRPANALLAGATGAAVAATLMIGFVAAFEDVPASIRMLLRVPRLHHTILNGTMIECYRRFSNGPRLDWAFATLVGLGIAFPVLKLPRRALLAFVLPVGGLAVFFGQGKGFPYHLHMTMLGTSFAHLLILAGLAKRAREHVAFAAATLALGLGLGLKCWEDSSKNAYADSSWVTLGATAELRQSRAYFDSFPWGDYFAGDLRDAARYIDEWTRPDDRVQIFGMDPYVLFLARRKNATPILYSFELNVDPALEGGDGARPGAAERTWLRAYRDGAESELLASAEENPPAAFVFFDDAPFGRAPNGEREFAEHCPRVWAWMGARYAPAARFGKVRVRLRDDVARRITSGPTAAP